MARTYRHHETQDDGTAPAILLCGRHARSGKQIHRKYRLAAGSHPAA